MTNFSGICGSSAFDLETWNAGQVRIRQDLEIGIQAPLEDGYLRSWFYALKHSELFIQNTRTGLFPNAKAKQAFDLFGDLEEHTNYESWWLNHGFDVFGSGHVDLKNLVKIDYKVIGTDSMIMAIKLDGGGRLALRSIPSVLDKVVEVKKGLLSDVPSAWPFFMSKMSVASINLAMCVKTNCDRFAQTKDFRLWKVGEAMNLRPSDVVKKSDLAFDETSEKHASMGRAVSAERKRGKCLMNNAAMGVFPRMH